MSNLAIQIARHRAVGFAGHIPFPQPGWDHELGLPPEMPTVIRTTTSAPRIETAPWWGAAVLTGINVGGQVVRDIFGREAAVAQYTHQRPVVEYAQTYGNAPVGYYYNSSGQLVKQAASNITDFIATNPLLVGGAILFVVVLFIKPPGRR